MSAEFVRIKAILDRHRDLFNLQKDGLGRDLCAAATDGVQECIAGQDSPDGSEWDELSKAYDEWKSYEFPGNPMAVLHGTMADPSEVAGEPDISRDRAVVTYGISEQARQEAVWFQEGNDHQPGRRFWGLTEASRARSHEILEARLKKG